MGKTFKQAYETDQNAASPVGDNPSGDEILGFDPPTGTQSLGMKLTQLATWVGQTLGISTFQDQVPINTAAIAVLQAQVNDPLASSIFNMIVADNTLEAVITIGPNVPAFVGYQVVADSDATPSTNWIDSPTITPGYTLPDESSHTYYFWYITSSSDIVQIPPIDALSDQLTVPGLILQANFTAVAPDPITDLVVTRTVGSETSSFDISFSAAVAGSSAIANYALIDPNSQIPFLSSITAGITTVYSGLPSDTPYLFQILATDENGLTSVSNEVPARTGVADAGVIGIAEVSVRASDAGGYEVDEDDVGGVLTVTFNRAGGTAGDISVLVRQLDDTALTGTNYTKTVENGTANKISFADGDATPQTLDIAVIDTTMASNLCFQCEIIKDSEFGGCTVDVAAYDWGRGNSVLCYVNGSAASIAGYQQETTGDQLLVLPFTDATYSTVTPAGADSWKIESAFDAGMTESGLRLIPDTWGIPSGATDSTLATAEVSVELPAVFTVTGTHYLWVRMYHPSDGSTDEVHVDIDDTGSEFYAVWAKNLANDGINPKWKWVNIDSSSNILSKSITLGARSVKVHKYENNHRIDKLLFTTNAAYDPTGVGTVATRGGTPSIDDNWGPTASTHSSGAVITDDAGNSTYPSIPAVTALDPDILIPADGDINIDLHQSRYIATFTGATNIVSPVITFTNNSTNETLPGVTSVKGSALNSIVIDISQNLVAGETYDLRVYASEVTDANGDKRFIDFSNIGDWQITAINPATDLVFQEVFDTFGTGRILSDADLRTMWNINESGDLYGLVGGAEGYMTQIADPGNSVARGDVLRVKLPGGKQYQYPSLTAMARIDADATNIYSPSVNSDGNPTDIYPNSTDAKWDLTGGPPSLSQFATRESRRTAGTEKAYDEIYFAYDLRLDANWYFNFAQKLTGMTTGTMLQQSHPANTTAADGMYAAGGFKFQIFDTIAYGNPSGALTAYLYDALNTQVSLFLFRDGVLPSTLRNDYTFNNTIRDDWNRAYTMPRDTWVTLEFRFKLNTAPAVLDAGFFGDAELESAYSRGSAVADGCLKDGILEVWVTDPRPVSLDPYQGGTGGAPIKMVSINNIMWRFHQAFKLDKVYMNIATNAPHSSGTRPNNITDQYLYIDNVRASENPITHT